MGNMQRYDVGLGGKPSLQLVLHLLGSLTYPGLLYALQTL